MIALSIAAVLDHYGAHVSVSATGWRSIRCPFHADKTASASVNLELNGFRCHACDISGDGIKIIEQRENMNFGDAVEFARQIFGESIEDIPQPANRKPGRSQWDKNLFD